jgi:N4-gp56 family major capsid protein
MSAPKTKFVSSNALTRKRWAKDLFKIILPAVEFNYLIGSGSDSIVQMRSELGKGQGDAITFGIRLPLTGEGVVGDDTLEGTEEGLRFKDFSMTIEELNHAVDTGGKMEEQRIPYNLVTEGKSALQDWWADLLSDFVINCLCGVSSYKVAGKTFAQANTEPTTYHHLKVNDVAEASMTAADVMDLTFLDRMKQRAELMNKQHADCFKVRPLKKSGKNKYRVILHNYVFDTLRQNTNVGQWGDLLRAAGKLSDPSVEIEYNGLMVSKSERIPAVATNVYRNVLCGAQAATWAWGGAGDSKSTVMAFHPYTRDADRFLMIRGGGIFGCKKVVFNSQDYGCIAGSSYATAIS